ncbi:MAG: hypothetical protein COS99_04480 [Candidatus Omnitrophica bacterium CG07_land_8_20_14_0_80_42_15]|uniref:Type II secretion system protein GspC N-terminal domain-containing protein n=1 Tax=Candidatus Aquitaenariimonas noxiae TaxID=1974741 RepID=A0A2J0L0G0_9BACT|nr:MAG: hypothetical protein COS99_04480 [Candidatus Omnitrophica bacterium CG07_land_8_20_14_0_80_42_15]
MSHKLTFLLAVALIAMTFIFSGIAASQETKKFTYDSKGKKDPFVPHLISDVKTYASLENVETADDLILEGIIWDAKGNSAVMLNGAILKEGDEVSNIKILKITAKKVILTIYSSEYELNLQKEEEKK